jgi:hypothetical protein
MISTLNVAAVALGALAFWTCIGAAITRRVLPASLALPLAPTVGWSVHSALALPLFCVIGFSWIAVVAVAVLSLLASLMARRFAQPVRHPAADEARVPAWGYVAAALLACATTIALLPKSVPDGVILADQIYDHVKVAMVDDMARLGVPPGNPFVGGSAGVGHLVYYYLLHFSAAELAVVFHVKGWAATAAMTFVAAFASLALMMGLAVRLAGRRAAALWVVPLALAGSLRPILHMIWPAEKLDAVLIPGTGLAGWLFQSAWVPQHIMSASCAVAATILMGRLGERGFLRVVVLALLAAAGFESSAWIGGVTFAVAAPVVGAMLLVRAAPEERVRLVLHFVAAAALTILIASPLLHDQLAATSGRETGAPVAFHVHAVLGDFFAAPWRRLLDVPAYWLVLLPFALPAIAITGWIALARMLARRGIGPSVRRDALALALLGVVGLAISGLLTSTLGDNNDLGWRAALPGIVMLTAFAAAGISEWTAVRARLAVAAALVAIALGLPRSVEIIRANVTGVARPGAAAFAQAPAMWEAVRHHAAPDERVLNNPRFLEEFTAWPGNISWALLANRRSCYAGRVFALIFTAMSSAQREDIDAQFARVFDGKGTGDDLRELATVYGCRVVVVTPADGAWGNDSFAASPYYRLVEGVADRWRIYRAVDQAR